MGRKKSQYRAVYELECVVCGQPAYRYQRVKAPLCDVHMAARRRAQAAEYQQRKTGRESFTERRLLLFGSTLLERTDAELQVLLDEGRIPSGGFWIQQSPLEGWGKPGKRLGSVEVGRGLDADEIPIGAVLMGVTDRRLYRVTVGNDNRLILCIVESET